MNVLRSLAVCVAGAVIGLTLAGPSAFAVEQVEVEDAITGFHCDPECTATAVSVGLIELYSIGTMTTTLITSCNMSLSGTVSETGEAVSTSVSISPGSNACGTAMRECRFGPDDLPWHGQAEEVGPNEIHGTVQFCIEAVTFSGSCLIEASMELEGDGISQGIAHHVTPFDNEVLTPTGGTSHAQCESAYGDLGVEGAWTSDDVEVHHL